MFIATGRPELSRDPFPIASKAGQLLDRAGVR